MLMLIFVLIVVTGAFLVAFLIQSDRGTKEPPVALWEAAGFGVLAYGLSYLIEHLIFSGSNLALPQLTLGSFIKLNLTVGIVEEFAKFLPLAFFIHKKRYFNEHNDGLIYFGLVGLTFAVIENTTYLIAQGAEVGITRVAMLLFFHAATTGIVGFYLAKHKLQGEKLTKTIWALVGVTLLHSAYNSGVILGGAQAAYGEFLTLYFPPLIITSSPFFVVSQMITLSLNTGLFLYYRKAQELDQVYGLAAAGHNEHCRHCGRTNHHHMLYCEHCGNRT